MSFLQLLSTYLLIYGWYNHTSVTLFPTISFKRSFSCALLWDHSQASLGFYALKPNESLTVRVSLWSFADLSLTAWELPAKTSNEILVLTVVTGEGGTCYSLISPSLFSLSEDSLRHVCFIPIASSSSLFLFRSVFLSFPPSFVSLLCTTSFF